VIKACIFDLDGVLVDTARYHYLAWKRLALELGIDLTEDENERLKGVSRMDSLEIILRLGALERTLAEKEALAAKKNAWFVDYIMAIKPEEIFPGVRDLLHRLRERGLKIALASSSKNADTVIRLLMIANDFDAVVDGNMVAYSKPDPEIFLCAASLLHVAPHYCLVFEDAAAGIEAAVRAGMKCVGVGTPDVLGKANLVIPNTADFDVKNLDTL
jgi:beta-phosphoglucomutase